MADRPGGDQEARLRSLAPAFNPSDYVTCRRMTEDRWILDNMIATTGIDWDQGRTQAIMRPCGLGARGDLNRISGRIKKFDDIHREFATAAARRERLSAAAEDSSRTVEAREHAFIAAMLWSGAEWPLFGTSELQREYSRHKVDCYARYIRHADHPVRSVQIPFPGGEVPAYLHLPRGSAGPHPVVIHIGGMDGVKEQRVSMYGDSYLERGVAALAVELPGQGEALTNGLFVTEDSAVAAGRGVLDWVAQQPELDSGRIALTGSSFGSYWATQIAAAATDELVGCAVARVVHEPGMHAIFGSVSPTFKARFMYMSGYTDEDAFDEFAARLDPAATAGDVRCPYLVLAAENDELSPLNNTVDLLRKVPGVRSLVLYAGERHALSGGPATSLGPTLNDVWANWVVDRLTGVPAEEGYEFVDVQGRVHRDTPPWS